MSQFFASRPSAAQLCATVFWCLLLLSLSLGFASLCVARFGPFKGTFLDLYLVSSPGIRSTLAFTHLLAGVGFGLIWLASPQLRYRHRWLSLIAFIMLLLAAALPG